MKRVALAVMIAVATLVLGIEVTGVNDVEESKVIVVEAEEITDLPEPQEVEVIEVEEVEVPEQEKVYHTYIDEEYIAYAEEIGEMYNVCPELIFAIIERESSGNPNAENGNCYGLMQVSERWHYDRMERLGVESLFDPYGNILVGVDYLVELFERYEDIDMVLMVYNGSSDAKERWENGTPTKYATGIIERSMELERLHGK